MVLDALSPQRRRLVVVAVCLGVLLIMIIVIAVIRPARARARRCRNPSRDQSCWCPLRRQCHSLEPLATALRSTGRTAVIVAPPGEGTGDLQAQASTWARWPSVPSMTAAPRR